MCELGQSCSFNLWQQSGSWWPMTMRQYATPLKTRYTWLGTSQCGPKMVRWRSIEFEVTDLISSFWYVNMPKLNGFEVLQKMRALSIATPAILLTARHEREDTVMGLKLGADDYVKKPFGLEELLLRVAAVLRRVNGESESALRMWANFVKRCTARGVLCRERN